MAGPAKFITFMIHERQVRQLCAIHAVNNLLQLPSNLDYDSLYEEDERGGCDHDHLPRQDLHNNNDGREQVVVVRRGDNEEWKSRASILSHEWTCPEKRLWRYYERPSSSCCCRNERLVNFNDGTTNHDGSDAMNRPKRHWCLATQQVFDNIAQELTLREQMLASSPGEDSTDLLDVGEARQKQNISLFQRLCSHHGTPYFGNYSIEVLQEALIRRGVELEFYRVPKNGSTSTKCLIGFILHVQDLRASFLSSLLRIGRFIPIVKQFCDVGRHWYAITSVQYNQHEISGNRQSDNSPAQQPSDIDTTTASSCWSLIDSTVGDISTFHTDKELHDFISAAKERDGCLVFGAYLSLNESYNHHGQCSGHC